MYADAVHSSFGSERALKHGKPIESWLADLEFIRPSAQREH